MSDSIKHLREPRSLQGQGLLLLYPCAWEVAVSEDLLREWEGQRMEYWMASQVFSEERGGAFRAGSPRETSWDGPGR